MGLCKSSQYALFKKKPRHVLNPNCQHASRWSTPYSVFATWNQNIPHRYPPQTMSRPGKRRFDKVLIESKLMNLNFTHDVLKSSMAECVYRFRYSQMTRVPS
jgi:hypothetical protein